MKFKFLTAVLLLLALLLAACAPKSTTNIDSPGGSSAQPATAQTMDTGMAGTDMSTAVPQSSDSKGAGDSLTKSDGQGNVTVDVTPESLPPTGDTFVFDVVMNTHSVELGMDLAKLSTLTTDDGRSVQATTWDAPEGGGHHVTGKLIFPTKVDGKALVEGAARLTLTIKNVDADTRLFTWQLAQ